jgi:hypothetical protein
MMGNRCPKYIEIDTYNKNKYTKNKLWTKLALFRRLELVNVTSPLGQKEQRYSVLFSHSWLGNDVWVWNALRSRYEVSLPRFILGYLPRKALPYIRAHFIISVETLKVIEHKPCNIIENKSINFLPSASNVKIRLRLLRSQKAWDL